MFANISCWWPILPRRNEHLLIDPRSTMSTVHLIHWKQEEAETRLRQLAEAGFDATHSAVAVPLLVREIRTTLPDAILIDLDRRPAQGRDIALLFRKHRATRHIPIIFVGGTEEKIANVRAFLPDAVYSQWADVADSITRAFDHPLPDPIVPDSIFAPYSERPLHTKLALKPGTTVALVNDPDEFPALVEDADQVEFISGHGRRPTMTIWFTTSRNELVGSLNDLDSQADFGPVWIAWPKRSSAQGSDLTQKIVREVVLGIGLVDYKVCSIDRTWTAMLFRRRRA